MAGVFIVFTALLLCLPDFSDGINIVQSPSSLFKSPGHSAELQCSHNITNYDQMYWYQQTRKGALDLIGYLSYTDVKPEEKFKKRFSLTGDAEKAGPSQGIEVSQTPQVLLQGVGGSAGMFCEHDGGIDYKQMYWYHQLRGQGIQLLVFSLSGSAPQFEKDFNEERPAVLLLSLQHRHVKMAGVFIVFTALLLCLPDFSVGIKVLQSPPSLIESPGHSAELQCSHDDNNYDRMYWYQQTSKGALDLIGYLSYETCCEYHAGLYSLYTMAGVFVVLTAFLLCLPDLNGINIVQSPPSLFESPGHSAELQCYHGDNNYPYMYWYQQTSKGALELIGYLQNAAIVPEEKFKLRPAVLLLSLQHRHVKMAGVFIVFTVLLLCLPDLNGIKIDQSPPSLFESPGRSAELNCSHDDSNYDRMYWYRQTRKGALELIGYQYGEIYPEEKFKERFKMTGKATEKGFLTISNLTAEDSAVYFCGASIHSAADHLSPLQ
ncbi:UNVERIFIED_CONTAM: hypothetical protein FKN15_062187 [Acipenser sinensis]